MDFFFFFYSSIGTYQTFLLDSSTPKMVICPTSFVPIEQKSCAVVEEQRSQNKSCGKKLHWKFVFDKERVRQGRHTERNKKWSKNKNAKSLNQQLMSAHIYRHSRFHFPHLLLANFVLARAEITFNSFASNYIHLLSGMEWKMEVNEKRTTRPHPARIVRTAHCEIEQ